LRTIVRMEVNTKRKKDVITVAQSLFREKGYESTSMRQLAKELNLEVASLYSHIRSKSDLLEVICFGMADKFLLAAKEVNDIYFSAEEKLRMYISNHVNLLTQNLDSSVVFLRDWRFLPETQKKQFISLRNHYEEGIIEMIQTGVTENVFSPSDIKMASLTILSSLNWIVEWYNPAGKMSPPQIANQLADFILNGLKKNNH